MGGWAVLSGLKRMAGTVKRELESGGLYSEIYLPAEGQMPTGRAGPL